NVRPVNLERSLDRTDFDRLHFVERYVVAELQVGGPAGAKAMAVSAVGVQVRSGSVIEFGRRVPWICQADGRRRGQRRLGLALTIFVGKARNAGMLKGTELIFDGAAVVVVSVELLQREGERVARPGIMTGEALGPAVKVPVLLAGSAGRLGVLNHERTVAAGRGQERRVGLFVVPLIRVAVPRFAVVVEDLR